MPEELGNYLLLRQTKANFVVLFEIATIFALVLHYKLINQ
jgi:hypothetical protein